MEFVGSREIALLAAAFVMLSGHTAQSAECGVIGQVIGLCKAVDDLDQRLADVTKTVHQLGEDAIKAVPGERWLQIIDDLNSGDQQKRAKAQAYLSSVAGVKIQDTGDITNYALSVGFDFDEN